MKKRTAFPSSFLLGDHQVAALMISQLPLISTIMGSQACQEMLNFCVCNVQQYFPRHLASSHTWVKTTPSSQPLTATKCTPVRPIELHACRPGRQ